MFLTPWFHKLCQSLACLYTIQTNSAVLWCIAGDLKLISSSTFHIYRMFQERIQRSVFFETVSIPFTLIDHFPGLFVTEHDLRL